MRVAAEAFSTAVAWRQATVAGLPLRRHVGHVGEVEVGAVEFDGSNRLWTWSSPLVEDAWGHAQTEHGAKQAFELWLREWLENFRPLFEGRAKVSRSPSSLIGSS